MVVGGSITLSDMMVVKRDQGKESRGGDRVESEKALKSRGEYFGECLSL